MGFFSPRAGSSKSPEKLLAAVTIIALAAGGAAAATPARAERPAAAARPTLTAEVETSSLRGDGDIADDAVIWSTPHSAERSVVIATSKSEIGGGIAVYDVNGSLLQFRADGKLNNVDLRAQVPLGGRPRVLVTATNRSDHTLVFYSFDPSSRRLSPVGSVATGYEPYGVCMYSSPTSGDTYAFVTEENGARVDQYRLVSRGREMHAERVRRIVVGSLTEGCVASDRLGLLFLGEEDRGIWRYRAEPSAGVRRTLVDTVGSGHLEADVEGLALVDGPDAEDVLVASSQGDSSFALYDVKTGAHIESFSIAGSGSVDGVQETDGVAATTAPAGPRFPAGMLVVHDAQNAGGSTSNYKYVDLAQVLALTR